MHCCISLFHFLAIAMIFLSIGCAIRCCAGNNTVCRSHYSAVDFCGNDAEPWNRYRHTGKAMAATKVWVGPSVLALVLLAELVILLVKGNAADMNVPAVPVKKVSLSLYREYIIAVELAGFLLMAGIVGAAHIGKHKKKYLHRFLQNGNGNMKRKRNE